MDIRDRQLIARSFEQSLPADEQLRLKDLLSLSAEARQEYSEIKQLRDTLARQHYSFEDGFTDRVMERLELDSVKPSHQKSRMRAKIFSMPVRVAASVVILCLIALSMWMMPQTYVVPPGETASIRLPDGSLAELASGSRLMHKPFWGRNERKISLQGEGFFDVAHDTAPFSIETDNAKIRVLGTRFNVRAWPGQHTTTIAVEEGRVETTVLESVSIHPLILVANEAAAITANSTISKLPSTGFESHFVWRNGGFAFNDVPLGNIAEEISRRYNRSVLVDQTLLTRTLGYFQPEAIPLEDLLTDICRTLNLRHRRTANGYEIIPPL